MARIWGTWAQESGIDGWVWDGAGGHKDKAVQALDVPQVVQPPYAPELNPVERFFQELRRALEGRVHSDPAGHMLAVDHADHQRHPRVPVVRGVPGQHQGGLRGGRVLAGGPQLAHPAQHLGLDKVAMGGADRVPTHSQGLDHLAPAPFQGLIDGLPQWSRRN